MFKFLFNNNNSITLKTKQTILNSIINYKNVIKNTICLLPLNITNVSSNETLALIILLFGGIISYAYSRKIKENLPEPQKQKVENTDALQTMNEIYNGTLTSEELQYYFFTYLSIFCFSTFSIYLIYLYYSSNTNSDDNVIDLSNYTAEEIQQLKNIHDSVYTKQVLNLDAKVKSPIFETFEEIEKYVEASQVLEVYYKQPGCSEVFRLLEINSVRTSLSTQIPLIRKMFEDAGVIIRSKQEVVEALQGDFSKLYDSLESNEFIDLSFLDYILHSYEFSISMNIFFEI
jgi:hypothetical protein